MPLIRVYAFPRTGLRKRIRGSDGEIHTFVIIIIIVVIVVFVAVIVVIAVIVVGATFSGCEIRLCCSIEWGIPSQLNVFF